MPIVAIINSSSGQPNKQVRQQAPRAQRQGLQYPPKLYLTTRGEAGSAKKTKSYNGRKKTPNFAAPNLGPAYTGHPHVRTRRPTTRRSRHQPISVPPHGASLAALTPHLSPGLSNELYPSRAVEQVSLVNVDGATSLMWVETRWERRNDSTRYT